MIRAELVTAIDFSRDKRLPVERRSYRQDGKWYIVSCGCTYCNIFRVVEYDAKGERSLLEKEVR